MQISTISRNAIHGPQSRTAKITSSNSPTRKKNPATVSNNSTAIRAKIKRSDSRNQAYMRSYAPRTVRASSIFFSHSPSAPLSTRARAKKQQQQQQRGNDGGMMLPPRSPGLTGVIVRLLFRYISRTCYLIVGSYGARWT